MYRYLLLAIVLVAGGNGVAEAQPAGSTMDTTTVLDGTFWKKQGLEHILPAWTTHATDAQQGAFFAELGRDWRPTRSAKKYPGMIGRHVFSYAAAYLMSGQSQHLDRATEALDFMIEHGWDERYGGWYNALHRSGAVADSSKDLFMQIYAATGLALYYAATRSDRALRYLKRTHQLLKRHAWDEAHGGYVRSLHRDLAANEAYKDFSPQVAPVSGYLLYLYRATGDDRYLHQAERLMNLALDHMRRSDTGWIRERFSPDWQFLSADDKNRYVNVGHNIEVAWMLLRLHLLTGNPRYARIAETLSRHLATRAFREETGAWIHRFAPDGSPPAPETTPWWVQAYGNLLQLSLYRTTGDEAALRRFRKGARFWNDHFVDARYGGTVLATTLDGQVARGQKGVRTKTSYHAMEHALLGYLLTTLWVEGELATLHFQIESPAPGEYLHPVLVNDEAVQIQRATINGHVQPTRNDSIPLPEGEPTRATVVLEAVASSAPTGSNAAAPADSLFDLVLYGPDLRSGTHRVFLKTNPGFGNAWEPIGTLSPPDAERRTGVPNESTWETVLLTKLRRERYLGQDFRENYLALKIVTVAEGPIPSKLSAAYAVPHHRRNTTAHLHDALRTQPLDVRTHSLASYVRPRPAPLQSDTPFVEKIEAPVRYERPGEAEVAWLEVLFGGR